MESRARQAWPRPLDVVIEIFSISRYGITQSGYQHKVEFSDTLFIGRKLRSTATLWPCGLGKHNIILNLMPMGGDAPW